MEVQVKETYRISWFNLFKVSKIRIYLIQDQIKNVIHAYITIIKFSKRTKQVLGEADVLLIIYFC